MVKVEKPYKIPAFVSYVQVEWLLLQF